MAAKKGGLGRGLEALFEDNTSVAGQENGPVELRITQVEPNKDQPRKQFDREALEELSESIRMHGLLQPVLVTPLENGQYSIVAGERRWRAARMAGLEKIPVLIRELSRKQVAEIALIENLQREDLNAMEEAEGYAALMEEFDMTQEEAAVRVGKSRPAVANLLRLLALPEEVKAMVSEGNLSAGHARTVLSLKDKDKQVAFAKLMVAQGWSVREAEKRAKSFEKEPVAPTPKSIKGSYATEAALALSEKWGRPISVKEKGKGGSLTIPYYDDADLAKILAELAGKE